MKKIKLLIAILLIGLHSFNSIGCDKSYSSVNYISEISPGVYQMQVDWCVGTTTAAGGSGGSCSPPDGSTYEMGILINTGTGINVTGFSPASLISSETGNTAIGSIPVTNGVLYATGSNLTLLHDGGASTLPNQYCYSAVVTFSATTLPTAIQVRGLESDCGAGAGATQYCLESATVPPLTVPPSCAISVISADVQTVCNPADNTYSQEIEVTYSNPPAGGNLVVNGQVNPITSSPQTVVLSGLDASGGSVNVNAYFSSDIGCTSTATSLFTAPATCYIGCDFAPTEPLIVSTNGDYNVDPSFTQTYILTDITGVILASNSTPNFGTRAVGEYIVYALNYETSSPPTLPSNGANISTVTGGCSEISPGLTIGVCLPSTLSACENSGDDIVVAVGGYNQSPGYNQVIVIVDNDGNEIIHVDNLDVNGTVTYTTTSVTGDLIWGNYTAYSVNYEDPETLASLGLVITNTWPGTFGAACVDVSSAQIEVTAPASCITGTSVLSACQDLGEDITISSSGFNGNYDFDQMYIMVDSTTNTITSIKWSNEDTDGITTFNTTGAGSLPLGSYYAYAVNYPYSPGAAFYGLTVGATWPPTMSECIDTSAPAKVLVEDCTVLPIGLEYFTGKREEFNHLLRWKLGDIETLKSINLEYSINQKNFKSLKEFNNIKYNNELTYKNYKTNDGHNYYRLKLVYKDESVLYSKLIDLNEKTNEPVFGLYPNPTTNHQFNIISNIEGAFNFVMTDVAGRVVMQQEMNFEIGSNNVVIIDESISKGVYVASIYSDLFPKKNIKVILD